MDEFFKFVNILTDSLVAGGPKAILFIVSLNVVGLVFAARIFLRYVANLYEVQLKEKTDLINQQNKLLEEKNKLLDDRFVFFQDISDKYMASIQDQAKVLHNFEMILNKMDIKMSLTDTNKRGSL